MNKKILATIGVIIIYAVLFFLFIYIFNNTYKCGYSSPCVRFCSSDTDEYTDKYLLDQFRKSKSGKKFFGSDSFYRDLSIKVIRGTPSCGEMRFWPPNGKVNSSYPPYQPNSYGDVRVDGEEYSVMRYCLEKSEDVFDGWKLMICYQDYYLQKSFHILTIFISIILLGFTSFVYAYFKELRDFYGKTVIALTGSLIVTFLMIPIIRFYSTDRYSYRYTLYILLSILVMNLFLILLWITVLIVHAFLTFRNFKTHSSSSYEFSTYAIFVSTFAVFSVIFYIDDLFVQGGGLVYLIFTYFLIGFVDIVFLIITGVKILITSRHLEHFEQARFDTERKWFWIVVKMSLIMLMTWPFEVYLWTHNFNLFGETTGDFINLLTAITIFLILVGREKARILLFGKYREVHDVENDVNE